MNRRSEVDVEVGARFSGVAFDVARLDRHPVTAADWDWVDEHLRPRITPDGVILDPDGEPLGPRPESPPAAGDAFEGRFIAPDAYGRPAIWRDRCADDPAPVLVMARPGPLDELQWVWDTLAHLLPSRP